MATKKIKTYTREQAEALARQGRRVRIKGDTPGCYVTFEDGKFRYWGEGWARKSLPEFVSARETSWHLLAPTRAELRAELAAVKAEVAEHEKMLLANTWQSEARRSRTLIEQLRAQLADAKAKAVPFPIGSRVVISTGHRYDVDSYVLYARLVKGSDGRRDVSVVAEYLKLAPEAKPAEPVWAKCTPGEALAMFMAGTHRVRGSTWTGEGVWFTDGKMQGASADSVTTIYEVWPSLSWLSCPLPEGGAGV